MIEFTCGCAQKSTAPLLQGTGTVSFRIFKNGGQHVETVDFTGGGLRKIII